MADDLEEAGDLYVFRFKDGAVYHIEGAADEKDALQKTGRAAEGLESWEYFEAAELD